MDHSSKFEDSGIVVDIETRREKQRALMVRMIERKVRSRAQELYESRGQTDGQELQDWFQAETEVLENSIVAPLYRRLKMVQLDAPEQEPGADVAGGDVSACEATV